jgi:prepilin-type N-terminal cleavage/methylation domain-containing protein
MKRFLKKEGGFTLIELLVVMLIIGILLLIAVPSLLGNVSKAKVTAQKSDLNTVYLALKSYSYSTTPNLEGSFKGMDPLAAVTASEGADFAGKFTYYSMPDDSLPFVPGTVFPPDGTSPATSSTLTLIPSTAGTPADSTTNTIVVIANPAPTGDVQCVGVFNDEQGPVYAPASTASGVTCS